MGASDNETDKATASDNETDKATSFDNEIDKATSTDPYEKTGIPTETKNTEDFLHNYKAPGKSSFKTIESESIGTSKQSSRLDFLDDDNDEPAFASFSQVRKEKNSNTSTNPITPSKTSGISINSLFESSEEEEVFSSTISQKTMQFTQKNSHSPFKETEEPFHQEEISNRSTEQVADYFDESKNRVTIQDSPIWLPDGAGFIGNESIILDENGKTAIGSDDNLNNPIEEHASLDEVHSYDNTDTLHLSAVDESLRDDHPQEQEPVPVQQLFSGLSLEKQQGSTKKQKAIYREDPTKLIQRIKEGKTRYKPIAVILNNSILLYKRITQQRYLNGIPMQKDVNVFDLEPIKIPVSESVVIKDEVIKKMIDSKLTEKTPIAKIEELLGITSCNLIHNDLIVGKSFLNELLQVKGTLCSEDFCKTIFRNNIDNPFIIEALKAKLGIPPETKNLQGIIVPSGCISTIITLNNPILTRVFLKSQEHFLVYFLVLYKLNLVSIMEFAASFYNNIYYLAVLKKISRGEDLSLLGPEKPVTSGRSRWSFKSVIDFGISKILNVEADSDGDRNPYSELEADERKEVETPKKVSHLVDSDITKEFDIKNTGNPNMPDACCQKGGHFDITSRFNNLSVEEAGIPVNDQKEPPSSTRITSTPEEKFELKSIFEDNDDVDIFEGLEKTDVQRESVAGDILDTSNNTGLLETKEKNEDLSIYGNEQAALSSDNLSGDQKEPVYKKKFSKSFADIFSLGNKNGAKELDVSTYADDVEENDKPMLIKEYEEETKPSFFNVFGMFKKKEKATPKEASVVRRPPRVAIKIPENPRKPSMVKELYANKKSSAIEIPGVGPPTVKKHVINPDRTEHSSTNVNSEHSSRNNE
ncbi:hypothetical protein PAEPH01_0117 [Pancytospora epiphaga]|nr:hypothetical protein PAEPH01_0117 [Pancytospora epiphaga]